MIGWMIYPKKVLDNTYGNNAFEWMVESAANYGINLKIVFKEDLAMTYKEKVRFFVNGIYQETPEFVIMRCYHYQYNELFESIGVRVINKTVSMFNTKNKGVTATILKYNNINTPDFLVDQKASYDQVKDYFQESQFVLKSNDGSGGEDVYLVKNEVEYQSAVNKIYGEFICQRFIASSHGKDIRLYIIGNRVIGGVLRQSHHDFRSNYTLGGYAKEITITEEMEKIALKACAALQIEFAGIDLLFTESGFTICEINGNAGFRTLSSVTEVDMGDELFQYISSTM